MGIIEQGIGQLGRKINELRTSDPRKQEAKQSAALLRDRIDDVMGIFRDSMTDDIELSVAQSERLVPSVDGASPINVSLALVGSEMYIITLERTNGSSIDFNLLGDTPHITSTGKNLDAKRWDDQYITRNLIRQDANPLERQLQGLKFGHRIIDTLLEIREETPQIFPETL